MLILTGINQEIGTVNIFDSKDGATDRNVPLVTVQKALKSGIQVKGILLGLGTGKNMVPIPALGITLDYDNAELYEHFKK